MLNNLLLKYFNKPQLAEICREFYLADVEAKHMFLYGCVVGAIKDTAALHAANYGAKTDIAEILDIRALRTALRELAVAADNFGYKYAERYGWKHQFDDWNNWIEQQ